MAIQVILKEDVHNLGKSGDIVSVKPGYGRNYLIPQGLAVAATAGNVKHIEHHKKIIAARNAKLAKDAQSVADKLASVEVVITRQAGEGDKLFGSVTARDIEEALAAQGLKIDRKKIALNDALKTVGDHDVQIKVARDVTAHIKVTISAKA